jgi:class 3 adenylate cyclase
MRCSSCGAETDESARFCTQCGARLIQAYQRSDSHEAERRPVSVMFCDLVDSTALSTRLDPEDLGQVIRSYQSLVAATIARFRGFVARYVGDGVLAYFGWPEAHEVDAEQAVRAGLAIAAAVGEMPTCGEALHVRIGIATGVVVIGGQPGDGARQHIAIGETPNVAARLQGLAGPDGVVIDAATRRQIGELFECRELGSIELKGLSRPVLAWQVLGETAVESRFAALRVMHAAPLIGRDEELDLLERRWGRAKAREGQVVLVVGEPGIGKSRLIAALEERLEEPHATLRFSCLPHNEHSALHPLIARWERESGFAHGDTTEQRLRKLETALAPLGTPREDVALIADLMSVRLDQWYPKPELSPRRRKEKTFEAVNRWLVGRTRGQPSLVVVEDVHWADPTTLDMLGTTIGIIAELPVLLVATSRPEFEAQWVTHPAVRVITLGRLDSEQSVSLAKEVTRGQPLPADLIERIAAHADGVPLFIEELAQTVMEDMEHAGHASRSIPATLQASLLARLDLVPAGKHVAQIGACIGREFSWGLLEQVAGLPPALLAEGLEQLLASGLLFQHGAPPDAAYTFKHALVQDAAYESLLRSRRAEIHSAIVQALEHDHPEIGSLQPALIGWHCVGAGLIERAAGYYQVAGKRAEELSALAETQTLAEHGLALVATLPDDVQRRRLEAELLVTLGRVLHIAKGMANADAAHAFERAVALSRDMEDANTLIQALSGWYVNALQRADYETSWRAGRELVGLGHHRGEPYARMLGYVALGATRLLRGRFRLALAELDMAARVVADLQDVGDTSEVRWHSPMRSGQVFLAIALACLGRLDEAAVEAAIAERAIGLSSFGRAIVLTNLCRLDMIVGDVAALDKHRTALRVLATEQRFRQFIAQSRFYGGWLEVRAGVRDVGIGEMKAALAELHAMNYNMWNALWYLMLADALARDNRSAEALVALDEGLSFSARTGEACLDAELHRRKGELLMRPEHADPILAQREIRCAISVAQSQSARLFEQRAYRSLSRHRFAAAE